MTPVHQAPPAESRDWVLNAACRGTDPETFDPKTSTQSAAAIRICSSCPVLEACLKAALEEELADSFGPWLVRGGMTKTERASLTPRARTYLINSLTKEK